MCRLLFFGFVVMLSFLGQVSIAQGTTYFEDYSNQYIETLSSQESVSRYDLTRALSLLSCEECTYPPQSRTNSYSEDRLDSLTSQFGNNFDDLTYPYVEYAGENYYYCVSYIADQGWMNGFPASGSPLCPGRFCGANSLVYTDFSQSLYNMYKEDLLSLSLSINWDSVWDWFSGGEFDVTVSEEEIVRAGKEECGEENCPIRIQEQLDIYVRYCRHHLEQCGMRTFPGVKQGVPPIATSNLLVRRGLLDEQLIQDVEPFDVVPGLLVAESLRLAVAGVNCSLRDDYDGDGIKNKNDNCIYSYDPDQSDFDSDGTGDVCDDDIDGDGRSNKIGFIDDRGIIREEIVRLSEDKELGENIVGETIHHYFDVVGTPIWGRAPVSVDFETVFTGDVEQVEWDFDTGEYGVGESVSYVFTQTGEYVVKAVATFVDGVTSVAKDTVIVTDGEGIDVGFAGVANPLIGTVPLEITLSHVYEGSVDEVVRLFGAQRYTVAPGDEMPLLLENEGIYELVAEAYNEFGEWVGISQLSVTVDDDESTTRGAYLIADSLVFPVGSIVTFSTETIGFSEESIKNIEWDYGDLRELGGLEESKRYAEPGSYIVNQIISFTDGHPDLHQMLTVRVTDDQPEQKTQAVAMEVDPLLGYVGNVFGATIIPTGIESSDVSTLTWGRGDGFQEVDPDVEENDFSSEHIYWNPGVYRVRNILSTNEGKIFVNESTVEVLGESICDLDSGVCDQDGDEIIDLCDTDIDGDGFENLLGILIGENEECTLDEENIDQIRLEEQIVANENGGEFDNCFFDENEDQVDSDDDGYGDVCDGGAGGDDIGGNDAGDDTGGDDSGGENAGGDDSGGDDGGGEDAGGDNAGDDGGSSGEEDSDNDGIPDSEDDCPGSAESGNGYLDGDGCPDTPELGDGDSLDINDDPFVIVDTCVQCPCPKADYAAQVVVGDRVKAILSDPSGQIVYSHSSPRAIRDLDTESE